MRLVWNASLATGSAQIDQQHRKLFEQLAALEDAMKQGKGRQEIGAILDFLGDYVVQHFADEERLMDETRCPAAAANKQAHAQFLSTYAGLRSRFDSAGGGPALVLEIHDILSKWLVGHIGGIDVQLRGCTGKAAAGAACAAR
ncbi:MAG: hemerythrin family protein [Thermoguttaceae bacterium]|jgi:hemerythrin|nr:hemerythrin family protein [Thermoguttaceae bacterium]